MSVTDVLKQRLLEDPLSLHQTAKAAGVLPGVVVRLADNRRGISGKTVDRLAKHFDLRLAAKKRTRKRSNPTSASPREFPPLWRFRGKSHVGSRN